MKGFKGSVAVLMFGLMVGCTTPPKDDQLVNLALDEIMETDYAKAEEYLVEALAENPDNPYALINMGVVYHNTDRKEQAQQMYRRAIDLEPDSRAGRASINDDEGRPLVEIARKNLQVLEADGTYLAGSK
jgi:Tfp pilus assembly protein PilF